MAIELIATVGGEDSNSYISLADAEAYFTLRMPAATNWLSSVSDDDKSKALITATRLLDQMIEWDGSLAEPEQALLWPREELVGTNGLEIPGTEIPPEIGWAVCEFANELLANDPTADLQTEGISSIGVAGVVNISFDSGNPPARTVLPSIVWDFVGRWGRRLDATMGVAKIIRG